VSKNKSEFLTINDRKTDTDTDNFHVIDTIELEGLTYNVFEISASNREGLTVTIDNALIPVKQDFVDWLQKSDENLTIVYNHILNSFKTDIANRIRPKETLQEKIDKHEKNKKALEQEAKIIEQLKKQQQ
jgi:hypothetical protein